MFLFEDEENKEGQRSYRGAIKSIELQSLNESDGKQGFPENECC